MWCSSIFILFFSFPGRQFHKCDGGKCNFFVWADQPQDAQVRRPQYTNGFGGTPQRNAPPAQPDGNTVQCNCGQDTKRQAPDQVQ